MIEVSHLTKKYGSRLAVDDISFTVEDGVIYGLLGPNGAGKSTIMNILTGYLAATEGQVTVAGHPLPEEADAAKACVGYLPEQPPLYPEMTVAEYLDFAAELKGVKKADRPAQVQSAAHRTGLEDVLPRLIRSLSKGYRQRVGVAQALLGSPQLIILDEPTVGLDPAQVIELRRLIRELGRTHTVILSSHILSEVKAVCDKALILSQGHLAAVVDLAAEERDLEELFLELTAPEETSDKKAYIICPICYNSSNSGYRHIINNPHYNCEDRKRQPSVGYDSVDLIGGCKFLSCRGFCIALSNNGRDIYITLVCDNTLCIIIEFIFQSLYFVRHIRNTLHLLYDLVIFLDKLDCKETFLSLCNSSCQLILNRFDRILNILCKFVNRNCFLFALCCADCFLSSFHDSGSFQSGNLNYFAAKLFA